MFQRIANGRLVITQLFPKRLQHAYKAIKGTNTIPQQARKANARQRAAGEDQYESPGFYENHHTA